jgi:glyceraldehyde-3-phosphate dehydrogenase/erythrose-4-phosphate dehydrogenase
VVAINDPFLSPDYASYMLRYDSVHGTFKGKIDHDDDGLIVDGKKVKFFAERCACPPPPRAHSMPHDAALAPSC